MRLLPTMKFGPFPVWIVCLVLLGRAALAQGTFQNLNFELATVPISQTPSSPGVPSVDIAAALPGWIGYIGTNQVSLVGYNTSTLDTSSIALVRTNYPSYYTALQVIDGTFSVFLMGGTEIGTFIRRDASLSQTSLIPVTAQSIRFKTSLYDPFVVSLDGQILPQVTLQTTSQYVLHGADVTAFSGQVKELKFTIFSSTNGGGGIGGILDAISFSNQPIPEPGTLALFGLGALLLAARSRKFSKP